MADLPTMPFIDDRLPTFGLAQFPTASEIGALSSVEGGGSPSVSEDDILIAGLSVLDHTRRAIIV